MEWNGQLYAPVILTTRDEYQYPQNRGLCGAQGRSGGFGQEEHVFPLPRIEPRLFDYPSSTTVTILTELSRLTKERGRECTTIESSKTKIRKEP